MGSISQAVLRVVAWLASVPVKSGRGAALGFVPRMFKTILTETILVTSETVAHQHKQPSEGDCLEGAQSDIDFRSKKCLRRPCLLCQPPLAAGVLLLLSRGFWPARGPA